MALVLCGCSSLRSGAAPWETRIKATPASRVAEAGSAVAGPPRAAKLHLLDANADALAARLHLAAAAERRLDLQYYLLHRDRTGRLLLAAVLEAADRGVDVRLLLDDVGLLGRDAAFASLDAHPRIEVRIFNPFLGREDTSGVGRLVELLAQFRRLNHRMHNKLMVADGERAILGGRNIGDAYLAPAPPSAFQDMDLLVAGAVVRDLQAAFDAYWESRWTVPLRDFRTGTSSATGLERRRRSLMAERERPRSAAILRSASASRLQRDLEENLLPDLPGRARVLHDDPEKVGSPAGASPFGPELSRRARSLRRELLIISPYFIPGEAGLELLRDLVGRGVRVRVLTNSLASTDVTLVHGAYAGYRERLLAAGVELHELRPGAQRGAGARVRPSRSGKTMLHAKAFVFDGRSVCIGSMNADPRSIRLNTEVGLLVESRELAQQIGRAFAEAVQPRNSYRLFLRDGQIAWLAEGPRGSEALVREPAPLWRRWLASLLGLLPLEDQL